MSAVLTRPIPTIWTRTADCVASQDLERARAWRQKLEQRVELIEQKVIRLEAQKQLRLGRLTPHVDEASREARR